MKTKEKPKKMSKSKGLSRKKTGEKLSTSAAIALALAPKKPKILKKSGIVGELKQDGDMDISYYDSGSTNLKDKLTLKELKFIEIYVSGEYTMDKAMILAGYEGYHIKSLYRLGRKIVQRYESQAGDHRIIARAMGAGETFIINTLLSLAKNSKSELIRLNATAQLAKILGLTKEILESAGGLTVIFGPPPAQPGVPGAPPPSLPGEPPPSAALPVVKTPLMITK